MTTTLANHELATNSIGTLAPRDASPKNGKPYKGMPASNLEEIGNLSIIHHMQKVAEDAGWDKIGPDQIETEIAEVRRSLLE